MTDSERAELNRLLALRDDEQLPIAGKAWNAVKPPGDAAWADLSVEIKGKLNDLAETYLRGKAETEGDYAPAGFFAAVRGMDDFGTGLIGDPRAPRVAGSTFSEDTSTHAPNENAVIADPNGPPVPESKVSTDRGEFYLQRNPRSPGYYARPLSNTETRQQSHLLAGGRVLAGQEKAEFTLAQDANETVKVALKKKSAKKTAVKKAAKKR